MLLAHKMYFLNNKGFPFFFFFLLILSNEYLLHRTVTAVVVTEQLHRTVNGTVIHLNIFRFDALLV